MAIQTKCIPVEAHHSVGLVERYHLPIRRAYTIITEELKSQNTTEDMRLQMAVKAVNNTAGYDGLVPTFLVFGAYPRISSSDAPSTTTLERARVIKMTMNEVAKFHAKRQVTDALHQRNGPQSRIHDTPIGSPVLVYRIHTKKWTGLYKHLAIMGDTCTVEINNTPREFRSTVVKPYLEDNLVGNENHRRIQLDNMQFRLTSNRM